MAALADIKLAHSVFALPFALVGATLARPRTESGATDITMFLAGLALIVACMVAARTWAMLVNRLADRAIDAENPRTARRAIPAGRLPLAHAIAYTVAAGTAFAALAAGFWPLLGNPWPIILAVPVLAWIALYSFTKRFTALCHLFLGAALAISPIAAAIALAPAAIFDFTPTAQALLSLAAFITCWVAGFDVAYALQDLDFDRERGLRSIPAALGLRGSLWVSRALHAIAIIALGAFVAREPSLGLLAQIAVVAVAALIIAEHAVLARRGLDGLPMAFFTLNGVASCVFGVLVILDAFI